MSISPTHISLLFFFVNLCVYMLWTIGDILCIHLTWTTGDIMCIHLTWTTGDVHYNTDELHVHVPSKQSLCLLFNYGMNGSRLHVCESYKSISPTHISLFFFFVNLCVYVSWTIGDILCIHLTWTIGDVHYSTDVRTTCTIKAIRFTMWELPFHFYV
jgi:hypothetical protein